MIYVLAKSYTQFQSYCMENKISPNSPLIKYISSSQLVRGMPRYSLVIRYGTWYERKDTDEIMTILKTRGVTTL